jgi:release factor glutamine methyltransferase
MCSASIHLILKEDARLLQGALSLDPTSAHIEVRCLLEAVLEVNHAWLLTHAERSLDSEQRSRYTNLLQRRLSGEPIAYLLGEREFFGLKFKVSPETLIPRPETELLVEEALSRIPQPCRLDRRVSNASPAISRVLDLGTGSGAIALTIAYMRGDVEVVAVDSSTAALDVARFNARKLGIRNLRLIQSDWFSALKGETFDIIVSNPPYIASGDAHLSQGDLRFEPSAALVSGMDGFEAIRHIVTRSRCHLNANGWLLLEHGHDQAAAVRALLQQSAFDEVYSAKDLSGTERVSGGSRLVQGQMRLKPGMPDGRTADIAN